MFHSILLLLILNHFSVILTANEDSNNDGDFGDNLISSLRNDANLDLSVDEEYEDLRSELLAYHTALSTLVDTRRSLMTAPCAKAGGICIHYKLCPGFRHLTEIPGCKNRNNVCCFVWNLYEVREHKEEGLSHLAYPWMKNPDVFGGKGVIEFTKTEKVKKKKPKKIARKNSKMILIAT